MRILSWIFWIHIWTIIGAEYFHLEGNDMKAADSTWGITATDGVIRKTQCLQVCSRNTDCGGCNFKEDGVNSLCEILPSTAVAKNSDSTSLESEWQFYRKVFVIPSVYFANDGLVCMPYDGYSDNPIPKPLRQSLTCTDAAYIINLWNSGSKDCKFTRQDNKEFYGSDAALINGNAATVWKIAFSKCHLHGCIAVVCEGGNCWLKNKSHLSDPGSTKYYSRTGLTYWYATCQ